MDVDDTGPLLSNELIFSSDNAAKGKRSAANLPVEAEDSLPWYDNVLWNSTTEKLMAPEGLRNTDQ